MNQFDRKYNDFISKKEMESLKDEFKEKPFFQIWRTTYFTTIAFRTLLQSISVLTFVCAVAYFFWLFTGSIALGVALGVSLSVIIEYNKNIAYQNAFRKKMQFGTSGKASIFFIILTSGISISLSYFGAPKFVEVATPKPDLHNIDDYKKQMAVEADSITNFWESHIEKNERTAEKIHAQNSWKGKTTKAVRPLIVALERKNNSHSDSLHNALSMHGTRVQNGVTKLENENTRTLVRHQAFLKDFGVYAALVTLLIEVLILLSVYWCIYYKFRSFKELVEEQTKDDVKSKTVPKEPKTEDVKPSPEITIVHPKKKLKKAKQTANCEYCGDPFVVSGYGQKYCKKVHENGKNCKILAFYKRREEEKNKK